MRKTLCIWFHLFLGLLYLKNAHPNYVSFQKKPAFSINNLEKTMNWFTAEAHPMGSAAQTKIAHEITENLKQVGWKPKLLKFNATVPNFYSEKFGGSQSNAKTTIKIEGINVVAEKKGHAPCTILLGGHYDTKYFKSFKFVGANDGGSSTVLLIELARVLKEQKFHEKSLGACDIVLAFFDGEEAFLNDWFDGENFLGIQDNLYGSREFVKKLKKKNGQYTYNHNPIKLVLILDMIGHKNQYLSISHGSDETYSQLFINSAKKIKISKADFTVEDDHISFLSLNIPSLHIIDWKNTKEWHTSRDTPDIISYEAIANLGETILEFLNTHRI